MIARDDRSGSADSRTGQTSRRAFLTTGAATSICLSAGPTGGKRRAGSERELTVDVSPAQEDAARDVVDRFLDAESDATVSLRITETTAGLRRFTAGITDVLVGSRPVLPAERSRAVENDVAVDCREVPTAKAALRHPESSWVDCLSPTRLADIWAGDGAVDTWAEGARRATVEAGSRHAPSGAAPDRTVPTERPGTEMRPTQDESVLVRGVRAYQYASGAGGVGYYQPNDDWLVRPATAIEADTDSYTPLVRLGYLSVDRESAARAATDFVRAYVRRGERLVGNVPYFADPIGGDERHRRISTPS